MGLLPQASNRGSWMFLCAGNSYCCELWYWRLNPCLNSCGRKEGSIWPHFISEKVPSVDFKDYINNPAQQWHHNASPNNCTNFHHTHVHTVISANNELQETIGLICSKLHKSFFFLYLQRIKWTHIVWKESLLWGNLVNYSTRDANCPPCISLGLTAWSFLFTGPKQPQHFTIH